MEIILVLPEEHIAKGQEIIDGYFDTHGYGYAQAGEQDFILYKTGFL